jgi:hypothetical protein
MRIAHLGQREISARLAAVTLAAALLLTCSALLSAQTPFTVEKNRVVSAMQPGMTLEVDSSLTYIGSQRFILYGVAQAEQHLFAERGGGAVTRFLWIQFEEYLPSVNATYNYSRSTVYKRFGRDWHVDGALRKTPQTETRPESDGARSRALLKQHGITLPEDVLYHRLVWLPTPRSELMFIYMESPESQKLRLAELQGTAVADSTLARVLAGHRERAFQAFRITP